MSVLVFWRREKRERWEWKVLFATETAAAAAKVEKGKPALKGGQHIN